MSESPKCDFTSGSPFKRQGACGRTAKWEWTDPATKKRRPLCGIHKRSVDAWYPFGQTDVQPITRQPEGA